jgi:DHA1 family bicyclomycin/chloramphenicol resistance-like MFS transporter
VLAGPLSDALGRRRPLLVGLAAYVLASVLCAAAPTVWALIAFRVVQGLAGAAGIVIARAVVRDLHSGAAAARFFALLMLVQGLAPILAPIVGAQLLHVTSWRGVFVALAIFGALVYGAVAAGLPETLPLERRHAAGLRATATVFRALASDRAFVAYTLSCGLPFAAMFAYIAGSPFVLQDIYGLSPQAYSLVFATNALGIVCASQVSSQLVERTGAARLLAAGLAACAAGGIGLLAAVLLDAGLAGVLPSLFVAVSSIGLVMPNATALALADHPRTAGSASALIGLVQFVVGAAAAPLVGIAGASTAVPMAVVIAALGVGGMLPLGLLAWRPRQSGMIRA